ncbi:LOW QUALITY PROTEIN: urea transporter 1 [Osmerus eperlanus]|uniref:LOW QUALITY PROTEIN: urea transporter 1 n=1 Tax=Osmerus eperlanus TaxID=29151 RepID=UPI002E10CC9B
MNTHITLLFSGLAPLLPFNTVILLFLSSTGPSHPYFPHHLAVPPGAPEPNATELSIVQLLQGVPLGVGQIYACNAFGPPSSSWGAVLIYSPLLGGHALLGSGLGTLAGVSLSVRQAVLYSGLSGFNGALGCMAVGGLFFTFSWRTHLFAIASGFLSAYVDIALSNLLGTVSLHTHWEFIL